MNDFFFPTSQRVLRDLPTIIRHKKGGFLQVEAIHPRVPNWSSKKEPPDMISDKSFTKVPFLWDCCPLPVFAQFFVENHVDHEDRQGPSLLALLNGPVDPRGDSNIFWAGPHGSNYVYKVGCAWNGLETRIPWTTWGNSPKSCEVCFSVRILRGDF